LRNDFSAFHNSGFNYSGFHNSGFNYSGFNYSGFNYSGCYNRCNYLSGRTRT
jgi:hypothetical protein